MAAATNAQLGYAEALFKSLAVQVFNLSTFSSGREDLMPEIALLNSDITQLLTMYNTKAASSGLSKAEASSVIDFLIKFSEEIRALVKAVAANPSRDTDTVLLRDNRKVSDDHTALRITYSGDYALPLTARRAGKSELLRRLYGSRL